MITILKIQILNKYITELILFNTSFFVILSKILLYKYKILNKII